jgi:hypothetical protein
MSRNSRLVVLPPQHLGHEIHVGRNIVIDMFNKGILSPQNGDCVLTGLQDRIFLYEAIFGKDHVFDFSIVPNIPQPIRPPKVISDYLSIPSSTFTKIERFKDYNIINLSDYSLPPTYCTFGTSAEMAEVGYSVPERYWNESFIELAQSFNFGSSLNNDDFVPSKSPAFVIIHHRYSASIDNLFKILSSLPLQLPKVIFTSNKKEINENFRGLPNLTYTEDLQSYAKLLKDNRCKILISEWSGAGQVAQYTMGPQGGVWYYHDHYKDVFNFVKTHKIWEHNAKLGTYFNCWDFKNVSGCDIQHFSSFDTLLTAIRQVQIHF